MTVKSVRDKNKFKNNITILKNNLYRKKEKFHPYFLSLYAFVLGFYFNLSSNIIYDLAKQRSFRFYIFFSFIVLLFTALSFFGILIFVKDLLKYYSQIRKINKKIAILEKKT